MSYKIVFTKQAVKDMQKVSASPLKKKVFNLLEILELSPLQPPCEKLIDQVNTYSKRINLQHRLVYRVDEEQKCVVIIRTWTHYGDN